MRDLFGVPGAKSPVKDPVYILGTRDYRPSGPSRHIHWKASARHLRLQENVFEPSQQEKVMLALEVRSFGKSTEKEAFEHTLEVIASLAVQLQDTGCAVGLVTNGVLTGGVKLLEIVDEAPLQDADLAGGDHNAMLGLQRLADLPAAGVLARQA